METPRVLQFDPESDQVYREKLARIADAIASASICLVATGGGFSRACRYPVDVRGSSTDSDAIRTPATLKEDPVRFFDFWGGLFDYHRNYKPPKLFTIISRWRNIFFNRLSAHGVTFCDQYYTRYQDVMGMSGILTDDAVEDPELTPSDIPGPFFILTNQVEGDFLRSGFSISEIYEIIGSVERWQCSEACDRKTWKLDPSIRIRNLPIIEKPVLPSPKKPFGRRKEPPEPLSIPKDKEAESHQTNPPELSPAKASTHHIRGGRVSLPPLPISVAATRSTLSSDSMHFKGIHSPNPLTMPPSLTVIDVSHSHVPIPGSTQIGTPTANTEREPHSPTSREGQTASADLNATLDSTAKAQTKENHLPSIQMPADSHSTIDHSKYRLDAQPKCHSCGGNARPSIYLNEEDFLWISNHACWKNYLAWMIEVCRQTKQNKWKIVILELGADQRDHSLRMMTEEFFATNYDYDCTLIRINNSGPRPTSTPDKIIHLYTTCDVALPAIDALVRQKVSGGSKGGAEA